MKKLLCFLALFLTVSVLRQTSAQGILNKAKQKAKEKTEQRAEDKIDKAIDKTLDDAENATNKDKKTDSDKKKPAQSTVDKNSSRPDTQPAIRMYARYDFVPGDRIIFADNLQNETVGEFPSNYNTNEGQIQVSEFQGEKVIQIFKCASLIPRINVKDYLPEKFTIEFDAYFETSDTWSWRIKFCDEMANNCDDNTAGFVSGSWIGLGYYNDTKNLDFNTNMPDEFKADNKWRHIAIAVNKTLLKAYMDQSRCLNVPNFVEKPKAITLRLSTNGCNGGEGYERVFIKNIRIAAGGIDLYKKATTDARIITHGITFDYNKSTIKPESMGTLNMIVQVMKDNPQIKFEVGGHTDSDGADDYNLKLSQQRADAVREQLIKMGIENSRLSAKGFGESKPLSDNTSPEGKANNRRVEFVKL